MPSFPDDLNLDKNPDVSKFSTFHIIVDNFSSLDNNFLKSNGSEQPFISKTSNSYISISTSVNKSIPKSFTVSSSKNRCCLASSTGVQSKKLLLSNFTSFWDITSKCVLSKVYLILSVI